MIETRINGRWTLKLSPHRACLELWNRGWEHERLDSMHANLEPGMLVYDIGAEEGEFGALCASWGCDVALFEPGTRVWANIKAVWDANDLPLPAATFHGFAAADDSDPFTNLELCKLWPDVASGPLVDDHGFRVINQRPDIPRIRIDTIAPVVGIPDALTIDVEGAELQVLRGATKILMENRPLLWISVHPEFMADTFDDSVMHLWAFLREYGYTWRLLAMDHELHCFAWHPDAHTPVLP